MATNTPGSSARVYHQAQTHFVQTPFQAAASPAATQITGTQGIKMGTLPAGAIAVRAGIVIDQVYNAGTNNQVKFGTTNGGAELAALANGPATLGFTAYTLAASAALKMTADTDVYLNGGFTGTAPTTGSGTAFLEYIPPESALV